MARVCSECGVTVDAGDRFCGRCGRPLAAQVLAGPSGRGRWSSLWVALPIVAVLAAMVLTNPSRQTYANWLAARVVTSDRPNARAIAPGSLAGVIANATIAQNDLIFTVFDTSARGLRVDVLGIFGRFVPLGAGPAG